MKNKILILALLVVFVSVSFIGCGGDNPKAVKEKDISITPYTTSYTSGSTTIVYDKGWIITWKAVGKNVAGYFVYAKKKDDASTSIVGYGENLVKYDATGTESQNTSFDEWSCKVSSSVFNAGSTRNPDTGVYSYWDNNGDYYFGIRAYSYTNDYSNIVWTKETTAVVVFR
jgi:hypothetical protein